MRKSGKNRSAGTSSSNTGGASLANASPAERDEPIPLDDRIRMRAFELYRERGDEPGDDLRDWLQAEREYRERS